MCVRLAPRVRPWREQIMLSHQSTHVTNQTHFAVLTDVLTRTHHGSRGSAEGRRAHPASAASIALPCGGGSPLIPPTITADAAVAFLNGSSCSALLLAAFCLRRRRIACKAAPSFFHASFAALNRPSVRVRPPARPHQEVISVSRGRRGRQLATEGGREGRGTRRRRRNVVRNNRQRFWTLCN